MYCQNYFSFDYCEIMHYIWELAFREIAVYLDLSINTVSARARYGLQKIKSIMGEIK